MNSRIDSKIALLINLILAQVLMVTVATMWAGVGFERQIKFPVQYIFGFSVSMEIALAAAAIYLIKEILRLSKVETDAKITAFNLKKNEELINVLRSQRHDFLNHIQVIYGLARLKKTDALSSYIGEIKTNLETEDLLGAFARAEFAAFLVHKKSSAIEQGINFEMGIFTDLAHVKIMTNELVSIVGNLLDNAFYAVKDCSGTDGKVLLTIAEEESNYVLSVANTGPEIPEDVKKQIFLQGFTTKGDKGSGLGLHIISNLLEKNNGSIGLVQQPGFNVCFMIKLPKK